MLWPPYHPEPGILHTWWEQCSQLIHLGLVIPEDIGGPDRCAGTAVFGPLNNRDPANLERNFDNRSIG
jgi:hypothetical protein